MRDPLLESKFPKLSSGGYSIESRQDGSYNCVAFAIGNPTRNWQWMPYPTGGYYWPPGIEGDDTIQTWTKVFSIHGYRQCENGDFEPGVEKIVLYTDPDGVPTHVARQDIARGTWISKLGKGHDIQHDQYEALEGFDGHEYGVAVRFMSRPRTLPASN
ncbi:MAG TPA: hypothetical protein VNO50_15835 [Pyrinomonadaceae bacterium]|nr:hypothetical protein [Pyrinomonadaceae bacterium]